MNGREVSWRHAATLVAVGLEGSGAQDGVNEEILEVAAVRLANGTPWVSTSFSTLIKPQHLTRRGPWITAGITDRALAMAPPMGRIAPSLMKLLAGTILVGHNITADQRLLHGVLPDLQVGGLIDTLALTHRLLRTAETELPALLDTFGVTAQVHQAVPVSQPGRALWDAVGAAVLLEVVVNRYWQREPSLADLLTAAARNRPGEPLPPGQ